MNARFPLKLVLCAAALVLFAGCVTPRVDWNARIGTYTYDQAVVELGPPDNSARLSDGRLVAVWVSRYSTGGSMMVEGGFYGPPGFFYSPAYYSGPTYYESKLLLTFNANNVLAAWSKR